MTKSRAGSSPGEALVFPSVATAHVPLPLVDRAAWEAALCGR